MKKNLIFLLLLLPAIGIAQPNKYPFYTLMTDPVVVHMNKKGIVLFQDSVIKATFYFAIDKVELSLDNVSMSTIIIKWDKSVLAVDGIIDKIAMIGVRQATDIPDSKLLKGTGIKTTKLIQRSNHKRGYTHLFKQSSVKKEGGLPIILVLPIEHNGSTIEYEFKFLVFKNIENVPDIGIMDKNQANFGTFCSSGQKSG